jgi:hypothetical protein
LLSSNRTRAVDVPRLIFSELLSALKASVIPVHSQEDERK